jgi:CheY-like chemotaxis protein
MKAIGRRYWLARESSAIQAANDATTVSSRRRHTDLAVRLGIKADSFPSLGKIPQASKRLLEPIRKIIPLLAPRKKPKSRILVVDDEDLVVDLLDHHLTRAGYDVVKAADGEAALERMTEALPAAVILAIMLPGIQGTEVLKRIRETPATRDVPVIMLSHRHSEKDIVDALRDGASDYLTKPFLMGELIERVAKLVTPYEHPLKSLLDELAA